MNPGLGRVGSALSYLRRVEELGVFVALAVMVGVVGAFHPQFLAIDSVTNLLQQASYYGIIALGMVFMLSLREVDLSVGSNMGFSAILCALLVAHGINPWLGSLIALAAGAALGVFNAIVANMFRLPLIIVTLGTLSMYQGLELVVANGNIISGGDINNSFFKILGGSVDQIPASAFVFAGLTLVVWFIYRRTAFAFAVRAIGSNPVAARLSGYPISRVRIYVAAFVGLLCAVSGVLSYAFFQSVDPSLGNGLELQVIAAAVIGGTALSGGRGSVPGALLGALIISVIAGGLTQFGVSINWASFVTGAVIVAAVSIDAVIKRRQAAAAS